MGRVRQVSNPYRPGSEPLLWTTTEYDALGRVKRVTGPDGSMVDTLYNGNQTLIVDEAAKQRTSSTDALGRLVSLTEAPESIAYQTTYQYNVLDNLTVVTQGGQTRTFIYDSLSRLTSATNPEHLTNPVSYQYDANGNVSQKSDSRGTITYGYDELNRVTSKSYTDGTLVTFVYDAAGVINSKGRLTSVSSSISTYGYDEYDALGRIKRSSQLTAGNQYLMSYAYNLAGNMTSQTYPSGRTLATSYDGVGRMSGVTGTKTGEPNKTYGFSLSYTSRGSVNTMRLGNGLWEHTNFNNRLQPTQIGLGITSTSTIHLGLDYAYGTTNNNGNVLSQTITAPGLSCIQSYSYDPLNRLQQADELGAWSQGYGCDRYGNRWVTSSSYIPNPTLTPQSESAFDPNTNRVVASQYDPAGNQIQDAAGNTYAYDLENRQTSFNVTAATYSYDGEGRRVKKVEAAGTTIFVYNALGQLIAEYSGQTQSGPGGISYLTTDHLGSTRVVTDAAGGIKARHDYLPFGEEISSSMGGRSSVPGYAATDTTRQLFTGKERDQESGLDYVFARYCSTPQGRFTSVDRGNPDPVNPQSWNGYAYVLNNPLKYVDPDGEAATLAGSLLGGLIGGGSALIQGKSWREVGAAAAGGAVTGAMIGSVVDTGGASLPLLIATGALATAEGGLVERLISGKTSTLEDIALDAGKGAAGAMLPVIVNRGAEAIIPAGARSDAYAKALSGGRHAGFLENNLGKTPGELRSGIRSFQGRIEEHQGWIGDPTRKVKDFYKLSKQAQEGLITKWQKDILRQREQQEILRRLLEEKTNQ